MPKNLQAKSVVIQLECDPVVSPEDRVSSLGSGHWGVWDDSVSVMDEVGSYMNTKTKGKLIDFLKQC